MAVLSCSHVMGIFRFLCRARKLICKLIIRKTKHDTRRKSIRAMGQGSKIRWRLDFSKRLPTEEAATLFVRWLEENDYAGSQWAGVFQSLVGAVEGDRY